MNKKDFIEKIQFMQRLNEEAARRIPEAEFIRGYAAALSDLLKETQKAQ